MNVFSLSTIEPLELRATPSSSAVIKDENMSSAADPSFSTTSESNGQEVAPQSDGTTNTENVMQSTPAVIAVANLSTNSDWTGAGDRAENTGPTSDNLNTDPIISGNESNEKLESVSSDN